MFNISSLGSKPFELPDLMQNPAQVFDESGDENDFSIVSKVFQDICKIHLEHDPSLSELPERSIRLRKSIQSEFSSQLDAELFSLTCFAEDESQKLPSLTSPLPSISSSVSTPLTHPVEKEITQKTSPSASPLPPSTTPLTKQRKKRKPLEREINIEQLENLTLFKQTEVVKYFPSLLLPDGIVLSEIDYSLGPDIVKKEGLRRWKDKNERMEYINLGLNKNLKSKEIANRYFAFAKQPATIRYAYNHDLFPSIQINPFDKKQLSKIRLKHGIKSEKTFASLRLLAIQSEGRKYDPKIEIDYIPPFYTKVIDPPANPSSTSLLPLKCTTTKSKKKRASAKE